MNMFEQAVRNKFRFESPKGLLSVEDLFDLPLTSTVAGKANLDDIAKALYKRIKDSDEVSFVRPSTSASTALQAQLEIVKYVIETKMQENSDRLAAAEKAQKKQKLLEALDRRENAELETMSRADILKALESL